MAFRWGVALTTAFFALSGCDGEQLYTNLTEREANQMLAVLLDAGIAAEKKQLANDSAAILVAPSQFAQAMSLLEARGLPADRYTSLGEVFRKEGIVSSPVEERARYIFALSQELSQTVAQIDGVLSARIHVVLPETDVLGRDFKPSSASVAIKHLPGAQIQALTPNIKMLVANSIEGLVYDNVTVVNFPAENLDDAPRTEAPLVHFAGVLVHPGSLQRLQVLLGGAALVALVGVGLGLMGQARRAGRLAKDNDDMGDPL